MSDGAVIQDEKGSVTSNQGLARGATTAISAAGVVAAHVLAYRLAHSQNEVRAHVLESSGHGYWDVAVLLALAGVVIAIGMQVAFGRRAGAGASSATATWGRLMGIQALTFVALESIERAVEGPQQLLLLLGEPAFWLALPLLMVTAALGVVVLRVASWAGAALTSRARWHAPARKAALIVVPRSVRVISRIGIANTHERAPPAFFFT